MNLLGKVELALDELGIKWREAGQSLKIQYCPACGSNDFKVHLRMSEDALLGRCYSGRCQENYSAFKYLLLAGLDEVEVRRIHGLDPDHNIAALSVEEVDNLLEPFEKKKEEPPKLQKQCDISGFFKLSDWKDHPATVYAMKRGATMEMPQVMIDPSSNAVVFVVTDKGAVVGYQKRFLKPTNPNMKTKSSDGFEKSKHLLHFPRVGAKIAVCEGPFTAIAAYHYGYYAICTFGSGVSDVQMSEISKISKNTGQPIGIAFDLDEAGQNGFDRLRCGMFWNEQDVFRIEVDSPNLPDKFDLNDAWVKGMKVREVTDPWAGPAIPELRGFL